MITITLRFYSTSISPIFLPLFSSVMCLSRPTGIGLPDMFAPMSNLEYRNVSPLLRKIFFRTSLQQLSTGKASGLDDLRSCFLKTAVLSISSSLTAIFNLFNLFSGIFPDLWKIAKVSPLHKDGSLFDRSNYRPISVLPLLSLKFLSVTFIKLFTSFFCKHEPLLDS